MSQKKIKYELDRQGYIITPCPHGVKEAVLHGKEPAAVGGYTCCNCRNYKGINVLEKCVLCDF